MVLSGSVELEETTNNLFPLFLIVNLFEEGKVKMG